MADYILKFWLDFAMGILAAVLTLAYGRVVKKMKESDKENKAIKYGVQALLKDRIMQASDHYREKGYCPAHGLENIETMYEKYKALDGNGTVKTIVDEMHRLPRSHGRTVPAREDQPRSRKEK